MEYVHVKKKKTTTTKGQDDMTCVVLKVYNLPGRLTRFLEREVASQIAFTRTGVK